MHAPFSFFLAGAAQSHPGQGFKTPGRDWLATFAAAGHAVDPFRPATVLQRARTREGGFTVHAFQFRGLIKNIHVLFPT